MNYVNDRSKSLLFLVGANGSGKTYALNAALNEHRDNGLLITEDGVLVVPRQKNRVSIEYETMYYYYKDEKARGQIREPKEKETITEKAKNVIGYCDSIKKKIQQFKTKSKGQEKVANIMDIFTRCNLNNIEFVFFDEPENYLDEEFLKVIANLFHVLLVNGFVVRSATHNPRLLNLLRVNIEQIILLDNHKMFDVSLDELNKMYFSSTKEIEKVRTLYQMEIDPVIQYKLNMHRHSLAFDSFVRQSLQNEDFYRCLFCKHIFIVEGESDIAALSCIKREFDTSTEIFNPNGKAFIPFFVQLFRCLRKKVTVIIDDDRPNQEEKNLSHPVAITKVLEQQSSNSEITLVIHTPNMEDHYNIDLDTIGRLLGMSNKVRSKKRGWLKYLAASVYFSDEGNRTRIRNHVLGVTKEISFEFT